MYIERYFAMLSIIPKLCQYVYNVSIKQKIVTNTATYSYSIN